MDTKKNFKVIFLLLIIVVIIYALYRIFFNQNMNLFGKNKNINQNELVLETILTEIDGGEFSYLKTDIAIDAYDASTSKLLKSQKKRIRRIILQLASQEDGHSLLQESGKNFFKQKIKKAIQTNIGVDVENIYFRNFVLAK